MLSPAKLPKSSGGAPSSGAPGSGAPGFGGTWAHQIAFSRCGLKFFFRVTPSCEYIADSTKTHVPAPFSLATSTARRSVVRCRLLSCPRGAVMCRSVPCCAECSLSCIPDNARKHRLQGWLKPECMSSSILCSCCLYFPLLSFIFHSYLDCNKDPRAVRMQQQTAVPQYVRVLYR